MSDQVAMVLGEIVILVMTCWMYPKVYQARIVSILNYRQIKDYFVASSDDGDCSGSFDWWN
jgi:hypothetical protein